MHRDETGSAVAGRILADWIGSSEQFVTVMPQDYRRVLGGHRAGRGRGALGGGGVMEAAHG